MLIAISHKMYFDPATAREWTAKAVALARRYEAIQRGDVALWILPSLPAITDVIALCADSTVVVGAQDVFWKDRGPYTGAVSGTDLAQIGCAVVSIGHAERRSLFAETDPVVNQKTQAAIRNGLIPLLCIGEPMAGPIDAAITFCIQQVESALREVTAPATIAIAYEPVWAIGQSEAASSTHVIKVVGAIKLWLAEHALANTPVIYGGSAGPGTLTSLNSSVDGLFLGRFAHSIQNLEKILDEVSGKQLPSAR